MKSNIDYIFGFHSLIEAIRSGKEIEKVFVKKNLSGDLYNELFGLLKERQIPFQIVPIEKINRITRKNHQGVVAYLSPVVYDKIENVLPMIYEKGETPLVIILDRVSDVRNFGAICRTAECAGVHAIIIPSRGSAMINADAIKTSAGALLKISVCREMNLKDTITYLKGSGLKIIAASEKSSTEYYKSDFTGPLAIIMGSEDEGVSGEYLKLSDERLRIPILGTVESLNVSVATGIIIYDVIRQRLR